MFEIIKIHKYNFKNTFLKLNVLEQLTWKKAVAIIKASDSHL